MKKTFTSIDQLFRTAESSNEELPEDVKGYFEYKQDHRQRN